jgi:hypothetical protein
MRKDIREKRVKVKPCIQRSEDSTLIAFFSCIYIWSWEKMNVFVQENKQRKIFFFLWEDSDT